MTYEINFIALTTKGENVKTLTIRAGQFSPEHPFDKNTLALQRFCVEFARLNGASCSFAEIISIKEIASK